MFKYGFKYYTFTLAICSRESMPPKSKVIRRNIGHHGNITV